MSDFESIIARNFTQSESDQAEVRSLRLTEDLFGRYVAGFAEAVGNDPAAIARWTA
jgi:hypothetical protein